MEDYKAILANTRKLYEVMCKSTPDFGKKKNYVLMTVNAKFGEWNGDMSVGVVMTDGDLEAPIVYCSFFNPKCDGAFMTVIIQFNNMIQIIVPIIPHEKMIENANYIRKRLDSTKEFGIYIWAGMGHKFIKNKTPSGKFIFMPDSCKAIRDIFNILPLDAIDEMFMY